MEVVNDLVNNRGAAVMLITLVVLAVLALVFLTGLIVVVLWADGKLKYHFIDRHIEAAKPVLDQVWETLEGYGVHSMWVSASNPSLGGIQWLVSQLDRVWEIGSPPEPIPQRRVALTIPTSRTVQAPNSRIKGALVRLYEISQSMAIHIERAKMVGSIAAGLSAKRHLKRLIERARVEMASAEDSWPTSAPGSR